MAPPLVHYLGVAVSRTVNAVSPGALTRPSSRVNEDLSGFGPLAGAAMVVACALSLRVRESRARVALAACLPVFLLLLALTSKYNEFLTRFLIVPAALTAPLTARLFSRRTTTFAIAAIAVLTLGLTLTRNELKPLSSEGGRPWNLSRYEAVRLNWQPLAGAAAHRLDELVPEDACVGALIGADEPAYLLFGGSLRRRVRFLPADGAVDAARDADFSSVVLDKAGSAPFASAGWRLRMLPSADKAYWVLATRRAAGACRA
jgi:hypothetical protein